MSQTTGQAPAQPKLLRPRHIGHTMLFRCIDDYFACHFRQLAEQHEQPFEACMAGGPLAFLLPDAWQAACSQVAASCVISGTQTLLLYAHLDCGAYRYFAGIDWQQYPVEVQIATLWRDLQLAEQILRSFVADFEHPEDPDWRPPNLQVKLGVIDLQEQSVAEPTSLDAALPLEQYRAVRVPNALRP